MTESYAVAARLTMTSNVPEIVAQMVRGFGDVNKLVKETQGNLKGLVADFAALTSRSKGIGRLIEGMEKMASIKPNGAMLTQMNEMATAAGEMAKFTKEMQTAQAEMARNAQQTAKAYREMAAANRGSGGGAHPPGWPGGTGAWATPPGGGGRQPAAPRARAASHTSLVDAGMGLGMAGDAGMGFFEKSIEAELEVRKYLASFRQNNTISAADLTTIRSKAEGLVRSVPGTTVAENLHTIMDAFTVVGDLQEAMAGSEAMSRLNLLFKSLPGAHGGDPGFAAAQSVELMQKFYNPKTHAVDINALNQQINAIGQVAAGTGGRQGAESYLAFTKQARVASMTANDKFLYEDAPAAMIAMGGSRFGTGMAALFTQLQTGTMTKNAANALKGAGLLDKTAVWKGGRVQDIGKHLRGADLEGANLFDWIRQEILGPKGALAQKGIDPNDKIAVARFLSSFTGRQTGLGALAEGVLGIGGIDKEAEKLRNTNKDPLSVLQANDPNMQVRAYQAAKNELEVTAGQALLGPAIEGMKALTGVLREIADWAKANPEASKNIVAVAAGMTLLAKAAGDLALIVFIGSPLVKGFGALSSSLASFSGGGQAATAMVTLTGASGLGAVAAGLVQLGAAAAGTVLLMKGFSALNSYLGIKPGKDNGPSPSGNQFMDGLKSWWDQFKSAPGSDGHNSRGGVHHSSYTTPPGGGTVQVHSAIYIDGRQIGKAVTAHQARAMSGPNTGTTGFDLRSGFRGSMPV